MHSSGKISVLRYWSDNHDSVPITMSAHVVSDMLSRKDSVYTENLLKIQPYDLLIGHKYKTMSF